MSPPIWLRDASTFEKKGSKNNQVKNFSTGVSKKNESKMVSDLLEELQSVMTENARLESENLSLRTEQAELQNRYNNLIDSIQTNKLKFEGDLNRLQDEIKNNETQLIDNSKKCVQQQKKFIQEIKKLKSENEALQLSIAKNETEYTEKIKSLESELKLSQLSYNTMKSQNEEGVQKSSKYKNKLKYAVTIINDLNNMLLQSTTKRDLSHRETQTEDGRPNQIQDLHATQSVTLPQSFTSPQYQHHRETENLLLSDVFFKSRAFCDNELLLFNNKESALNLEEIPKVKLDI